MEKGSRENSAHTIHTFGERDLKQWSFDISLQNYETGINQSKPKAGLPLKYEASRKEPGTCRTSVPS